MVASPRQKANNNERHGNERRNVALDDVTATKLLKNGGTDKRIAQLRQECGGPDSRRAKRDERCPSAPTAECERTNRQRERDQPNHEKRRDANMSGDMASSLRANTT